MTEPTLRVRTLIAREGHILLCALMARPIAFLPGGRVDAGETLEAALRREIREETGAEAGRLAYLGAVEHLWHDGRTPIHDLNHFFHAACDSLSPTVTPVCRIEPVRLYWVRADRLAAEPLRPRALQAFVRGWLDGARGPWWALEDELTSSRASR